MRSKMKNVFAAVVLIFGAAVFAQNQSDNANFVQQLSDALEKGSLNDALSLFDSLPPEKAESTDLLSLKASLLVSAGRGAEAEKLASDLLSRDPKNIDILTLNFTIAKERGNSAKKSQFIKQILAIEPNNAAANI